MRTIVPFLLSVLSICVAGKSLALSLDFSSGRWTNPPEVDVDIYSQDGFSVELSVIEHDLDSGAEESEKWIWSNHAHCTVACSPHQNPTQITFSGGAFNVDSLIIINNPNGLRFSADGGAFLDVPRGEIGLVTFPDTFDNIFLFRADIVVQGSNYGTATIDTISVIPEPSAAALISVGLFGLAWRCRQSRL